MDLEDRVDLSGDYKQDTDRTSDTVFHPKLDSNLNMMLADKYTGMFSAHLSAISTLSLQEPEPTVGVFLRGSDMLKVVDKVWAYGAEIGMVQKHVLTATVPVDSLSYIADIDGVDYVEAPSRLELALDVAKEKSKVAAVRSANPDYTGKDVIIGIIDSGIDFRHEDFRTTSGETRILSLWDQTAPQRTIYTQEQINDALSGNGTVAQVDTMGHGTHVASIAAGNGNASDGLYAGVAPEADLIIVKAIFDEQHVAEGLDYIFDKAEELNKPAVINLSLASHMGPHDGTRPLETAIDDMSGPGRIVVVAAGNNGGKPIHASGAVSQKPAMSRFLIPFGLREVRISIWYSGQDEFDICIIDSDGKPTKIEYALNQFTVDERRSRRISVITRRDIFNSDHEIAIRIDNYNRVISPGLWKFVLSGKNVNVGRFDAWIEDSGPGANAVFLDSDPTMLIGVPGTAYSAITVTSFTSKIQWQSYDGNFERFYGAVDDISDFSSPGPTRTRAEKPDLAAPGEWVVAAKSSVWEKANMFPERIQTNEKYVAFRGTSMATPHVTGAVALMLQQEPNLDAQEVKRRLISTAEQDKWTAEGWNPMWGHGKLNVEKLFG